MDHHQLVRRLVLGAIGVTGASVAAAGCGGIAIFDDGSGGDAGTSGTSSRSASASRAATATKATTATQVAVTVGTGGFCVELSHETVPLPDGGPCSGIGSEAQRACFVPPGGDPSRCAEIGADCVLDSYACGFSERGIAYCTAPSTPEGDCCFTVVGDCPVGRPFLVDGHPRLAPFEARADWSDDRVPDTSSLDARSRAALADFWAREGLAEHASVASFARFVLQLLATGAPSTVVDDAQRAIGDEIAHARVAFAFAGAYAGHPVGPGRLDVDGGLDDARDAVAIAVSVASEGCVAETVAALQVRAAADAAVDPVVRASLGRIADDELAHALLAWRYLAHAIDVGGAPVRAAVASVFASAADHVGFGPVTTLDADADVLRAHGYLSIDERRALAHRSIAAVVRPAAESLLGARVRAKGTGLETAVSS